MPCKNHHYIPLHESNIPPVDISLSRTVKTLIFALAQVANYTLTLSWKINIEPVLVGALSQLSTRTKLFMEWFS